MNGDSSPRGGDRAIAITLGQKHASAPFRPAGSRHTAFTEPLHSRCTAATEPSQGGCRPPVPSSTTRRVSLEDLPRGGRGTQVNATQHSHSLLWSSLVLTHSASSASRHDARSHQAKGRAGLQAAGGGYVCSLARERVGGKGRLYSRE
mgnify:CR=1 FL=1